MKQITDTVLMIKPTQFGFNEQAAVSNTFQKTINGLPSEEIQSFAALEFDNFVSILRDNNIEVVVFDDLSPSHSPDSIFPNNWLSTSTEKSISTYPMHPENRRKERRNDIINYLIDQFNYKTVNKFEHWESKQKYLEGTGSIVFDHDNCIAYAAHSPRTEAEPLTEICDRLGYKPIMFNAYGPTGENIYHTNVMMCVGHDFIAICKEIIDNNDLPAINKTLVQSGKKVIELTKEQTHNSFAGNMLQLINKKNKTVLVVSQKAYNSFTNQQLNTFELLNDIILPIPVPIIETYGGGSVRCMMAEVFY